jgi:hypothetical protein
MSGSFSASRTPRPLRPLVPALWIAGGGLVLWLAFGHGFANYDTFYALLWGNEIAAGESPDYGAPIPPTPHPLATALGVVLAPFGDAAEPITVAISYGSLAAIAYLCYRLGALWFNRPAGLVAAAIAISREPMLSDGVRAYVDVPYVALVLAALLVETKRPRAGWPVLALLALAGLLRPEAWLFSAAYLVYLAYTVFAPGTLKALSLARRSRGGLRQVVAPSFADRVRRLLLPIGHALRQPRYLALVGLGASAPILWALFDLAVTGDALYSLTGTRETVETLARDTGLVDFVKYFPRRVGEIAREPVLVGALGGGILALWLLRRRSALGAAAGFLAVAAFAILAIAGLAVITRYALLAATILAIFCGAGVFGWLELERDDPWRRRWAAFGAVAGVLLVVFIPAQYDRLANLQDSIGIQERIRDDLKALADDGAFAGAYGPDAEGAPASVPPELEDCREITVPNHRPVPLLALWLDRRPSEIVAAVREEDGELVRAEPSRGYFLDPASAEVEVNFTLDPNDPGRLTAPVPSGFERTSANESWILYRRCG